MIEKEITALEALGIAIRSEIDAQEIYKDMASMCEDELLKDKFLNLQREEKKHQILLEKMYQKMFPDVELVLPDSQLPPRAKVSKQRRKLNLKEVLLIALEEEKKAKEFYLDCAQIVTDLSGKRMFRFLADMEFTHQVLLNAELELLEKYPVYFEGQIPWEAEQGLRKTQIKRKGS